MKLQAHLFLRFLVLWRTVSQAEKKGLTDMSKTDSVAAKPYMGLPVNRSKNSDQQKVYLGQNISCVECLRFQQPFNDS